MRASLRRGLWIAAGILGSAVASCSGESGTTNSAGSSAGGGTGASSGSAGGLASSSSSAGGSGGAKPFTCMEDVASFTNGECDFFNQDCAAGQTCFPITLNNKTSTKCVDWSGVKGLGVPCKEHTECKAGLFCGMFCAPPCCPTDNRPCQGSCNFAVTFDNAQTASVCNYAPKCDLFVPNACKPGSQCHFDLTQQIPICAPPTGFNDEPIEGKPCAYLNDCGDMQICSLDGVCRFSCDLGKQSEAPGLGGCPPNRECIALDPTVEGYPTLGTCLP